MIVITRSVGVFKFERATPLAIAKQICDAIQGRILAPEHEHERIHNEQECYNFIMTQCGNVMNAIPFKVMLR